MPRGARHTFPPVSERGHAVPCPTQLTHQVGSTRRRCHPRGRLRPRVPLRAWPDRLPTGARPATRCSGRFGEQVPHPACGSGGWSRHWCCTRCCWRPSATTTSAAPCSASTCWPGCWPTAPMTDTSVVPGAVTFSDAMPSSPLWPKSCLTGRCPVEGAGCTSCSGFRPAWTRNGYVQPQRTEASPSRAPVQCTAHCPHHTA